MAYEPGDYGYTYNPIARTAFFTAHPFCGCVSVAYKGTQVYNTSDACYMSTSPIQYKGTAVPRLKYKDVDVLHKANTISTVTGTKQISIGSCLGGPNFGSEVNKMLPMQSPGCYNTLGEYITGILDCPSSERIHYYYSDRPYSGYSFRTGPSTYSSCVTYVRTGDYVDLTLTLTKSLFYNYSEVSDHHSVQNGGISVDIWKVLPSARSTNVTIKPFDSTAENVSVTSNNLLTRYITAQSACKNIDSLNVGVVPGYGWLVVVKYTCDDDGVYSSNSCNKVMTFTFSVGRTTTPTATKWSDGFTALVNSIVNGTWSNNWFIAAKAFTTSAWSSTYATSQYISPGYAISSKMFITSIGGRSLSEGTITSSGTVKQPMLTYSETCSRYDGDGNRDSTYAVPNTGLCASYSAYCPYTQLKSTGYGYTGGFPVPTFNWGGSTYNALLSFAGIKAPGSKTPLRYYADDLIDRDDGVVLKYSSCGLIRLSACSGSLQDTFSDFVKVAWETDTLDWADADAFWKESSCTHECQKTKFTVRIYPKFVFVNYPVIDVTINKTTNAEVPVDMLY